MKVIVKSVLAETELEAPPKSLFREIFLMICRSLGLQETWFFGLFYKPTQMTDLVWLDTSKKVVIIIYLFAHFIYKTHVLNSIFGFRSVVIFHFMTS